MFIEFVPPLEAGRIDAGGEEVLKLAGGEVSAVFEVGVSLKSVSCYSDCVGGGDAGEERHNIKADHDVAGQQPEILDDGREFILVLDVMLGVAN